MLTEFHTHTHRYDLTTDEPLFGQFPAQFGSFLAGAELFDAALFGLHKTEAALMDPQQRLLLECAAELVLSHGLYSSKGEVG